MKKPIWSLEMSWKVSISLAVINEVWIEDTVGIFSACSTETAAGNYGEDITAGKTLLFEQCYYVYEE